MGERWPPDYTALFAQRSQRLARIREGGFGRAAREYYKTRPAEFIRDWCVTYDPRNAGVQGRATLMPFELFGRQVDLVEWLHERVRLQNDGLTEKSRDMGATWVCAAFSVWLWAFWPGAAVGWGSRKEALVDRLGDPDSIFEKVRIIIRNLPRFFWPKGFSEKHHMSFMRVLNPETGASITGEAGDNIGRGGRKLIYFKDESAHYERAEKIEAALADNTRVQIDISSVNGAGNIFYRRRHSGAVSVFVMDWRDHPDKDDAWYQARREKAEREGLTHIFAQEVDRDYHSATEGIFIPMKWLKACVNAHLTLGVEPTGERRCGLDVADDSIAGDKSALAEGHGILVKHIEDWGAIDTGKTAVRAWNYCRDTGVQLLIYDSIGVGAGVKAKTNELREGVSWPVVRGWASSSGVPRKEEFYTEGRTRGEFFENAKAAAWWEVRDRANHTYRAVAHGEAFDPDRLISFDSRMVLLDNLLTELSTPRRMTSKVGKVMVETKDQLRARGFKSHNLADAVINLYAEFPDHITAGVI